MFNKFLNHCRHSTDREVALMMLMAYLSYMLAEVSFNDFRSVFPEAAFSLLRFYLIYMVDFSHRTSLLISLHLLQLCYLSGFLTVFFCGIVMSHYTWHNVTEGSRITTKFVLLTHHYLELWNCLRWKLSDFVYIWPFHIIFITDMLLQPCHSSLRHLSSFMWAWMHWTLKSGGLWVIGMPSFSHTFW